MPFFFLHSTERDENHTLYHTFTTIETNNTETDRSMELDKIGSNFTKIFTTDDTPSIHN
jgi:hypothetical protein